MGRSFGMRCASIAFAVALSGALAVAAEKPPAVNEGPWRIVLEGQLSKDQGCKLQEVLMFQELPLGNDVGLEGRVSCVDGRQFDFSRNRSHQPFRIELCQPAVC